MVTRRAVLGGAAVAGTAALITTASNAWADTTVAVKPSADFGTWEGWGTSLAWWANVFGARDDFADIFFTTKSTTYNGTSLPGLGLNIARYNLGACSWNTVSGETMVASANIPAFKQIEGYWQDWNNEDPTSSAWDWTADANQRAMLVKAATRGRDHRAVRQLPHVVDVLEPQPVRRLRRRQQPPDLELPPARLPPGRGRPATPRTTGA